ncbi:MAG: CopG family transcriptional regulator [Alphaproteobacteria bacterium]|nr:CopG family transcriptional regulator [Alphaproteobacteria bacterium]
MSTRAKTKHLAEPEEAEFLAAVDEGLAEADAGKGISYEKVRRWLLSWGSEKELPPPK